MSISLSVVIPAYNEEQNVSVCIRRVYEILKETDWDWEMLIVNDGSKDKTSEVAKAEIKKLKIKNARVLDNNPNRGYGGSLKRGFSESTKEFIAFIPADNQFDFSEIHKFVEKQSETDADIVSGIRPSGGKDPVHRLFFRWGWNTLVRAFFGYLATDVDCGFKLFRRSILDKISLPSNGAMIDTELYAGARARGVKIVEIPIVHLPRTAGKSTGGNPKVIIKALTELFIFWWQLRQELMVEKGKAVFRWEAILILLILLIGTLLRTNNISQYMTFLGDEGRDVYIVRDIILGRNFTIIGPGTSIGNMYLGPWYYYLMVIPLWLAKFSPVGPALMVAGFGVATIALLWWIGRQWFGRISALVVAGLYAVAPTVIIFSRSSWNPNIMPFFALLAMYGIWKVWKYGYWRWLVISALSLGFVLNSHYLGLLIVPVIGIYWVLAKKDKTTWKYLLMSVAVLAIIMLPLFVFDAVHGWPNLKAMALFFTNRQTTVNLKAYKALPNIWPLWQQIVTSLIAGRDVFWGILASWFLVITTLISLLRKQSRGDLLFNIAWVIVGLVGLGLYKQHIYDHYFGFLFPALFLLFGFGIKTLSEHKIGTLIAAIAVCGLLYSNVMNNPLRYSPNNQLGHTQAVSDFIVRESRNQNFNLALIAKSNYDMSYRYFLDPVTTNFKTIHQQVTGQLFVICEDVPCQPIGHPLWEIASFGWAKIEMEWEFPWGVKLYKLIPNPEGRPI
jgi:glycosyltransferase involved in cell wall biosynthesis